MSRHARRHRGFTLLEVIIAIAMAAALAVCLYSAMAIAFNARDTVRRQTRAPREASIALDAVRQDFESALPPTEEGMVGAFLGAGSGNTLSPTDTVEFYTVGRDVELAGVADPYEQGQMTEGVRWVQLALRTDVTPPMLVRRIDRNLLAPTLTQPEEQVLLTGVRSLAFRYYDGTSWLANWDSTLVNNGLPLAVEITLELDTPSPRGQETYRVSQIIPLACGNLETLAGEDTTQAEAGA